MGSIADIETRVKITTNGGSTIPYPQTEHRFALGSADDGKRESVSLTGSSTFTALTVPSGAKGVRILLPATATSLTLKGVTGDTGVTIVGASGYTGLPIVLPVSSPSIGILNAGSTVTAVVEWF